MAELDTRKLSNKAAAIVASKVVTALIELGVTVALVHLLVKREVAVMAFLLVVYQLACNLAELGLPDSVFYFYQRVAADARRAFARRTMGVLAIAGFVAGLVILGLSFATPVLLSTWEPSAQHMVARLLPILAGAVVLQVPASIASNLLLASGRARQSAWYSVLNSFGFLLSLLTPLLLGYGLEIACWGLLFFGAVRLLGSWLWLRAVLPAGAGDLASTSLAVQFRFAAPLGLNSLAARLKKYMDRGVVAIMLPAATLAEYHVGAQEVPFVPVVAYGVGAVLINHYVSYELEGKLEALRELWLQSIRAVSLIVVPATLILFVLAGDIITMLFGSDYQAAVLPFRIYTLILLVRVAKYGSILQAFGETRAILTFTLIALAINLVLNIPFTYFYGINGTATATLLATLLSAYLYLRLIARRLGTSLRGVVPWRHYVALIGLSALTATGALGLRWYVLDDLPRWLAVLATAVAFVIVFVVAGRASGLVSSQQLSIARGWMRLDFLFR